MKRLGPLVIVICACLVLPGEAGAHSGSTVVALDDEARLDSRALSHAGVEASVVDGDRKLRLSVARGHEVTVPGYVREPFLRFDRGGVWLNERAPTAYSDRLVTGGSPALDPAAAPRWRRVAGGGSFAWHDHRLAPPAVRAGDGAVAEISVPLVVDGRPQLLHGVLWRTRRPAAWPWLVLGAAVAAGGVALGRSRGRQRTAVALAAAAGAGALASVTAIALRTAVGAGGQALQLGAAFALAAVAVSVFALTPRARAGTAAAVAVASVVEGLSLLPVFRHGIVVSALPAQATRAAAAIAIAAGIAALLLEGLGGRAPARRARTA